MSLYLTEKIQIHPSQKAIEHLWSVSYVCKNVWNYLNGDKITNRTGYYIQKKLLPGMKAADPGLCLPSSQVLQEVVKELHGGWKSFFELRKKGDQDAHPPGFRSYKRFYTQKYPQNGTSFEIVGNMLRLSYGSSKRDWIEIPLPETKADPALYKSVTVFFDDVSKNWYVSFAREVSIPPVFQGQTEIWFDPGCRTALTGIRSDLTFWEYDLNPLRQLNMKHYKIIDNLKSERDTKKKGSNLYRRHNAKIKRMYRKINTQTRHYLHVLANQILKDHPDVATFSIGDWDKRQTLADTGFTFVDKKINRQVQNNNPLQKLIGYLSYKARILGKQVKKFDERGTTRTCSHDDFVLTSSPA